MRLYVAMHDPLRVAEIQGLRTTSHALFSSRVFCYCNLAATATLYLGIFSFGVSFFQVHVDMHAHHTSP